MGRWSKIAGHERKADYNLASEEAFDAAAGIGCVAACVVAG